MKEFGFGTKVFFVIMFILWAIIFIGGWQVGAKGNV